MANRLLVSAIMRGEESWSLEISAGGLVSALLGVKEFEARWIGWACVNVPDEAGQKALTKALVEKVQLLNSLSFFFFVFLAGSSFTGPCLLDQSCYVLFLLLI